jgi:hypothetical protein
VIDLTLGFVTAIRDAMVEEFGEASVYDNSELAIAADTFPAVAVEIGTDQVTHEMNSGATIRRLSIFLTVAAEGSQAGASAARGRALAKLRPPFECPGAMSLASGGRTFPQLAAQRRLFGERVELLVAYGDASIDLVAL